MVSKLPKQSELTKVPYNLTAIDKQILDATKDDISLFCEHYFDIEPMPWQSFFYHAPQKQKIVVAGIRSGKTFSVSLGFLHFATFNPYSRIANASLSLDQAKIVFYSALELASKHNFERYVDSVIKHPFPTIRMVNGSEMWFRSVGYEAELWRGQEFDWINVDEAAYIPQVATISTLQGRLLGKNNMTNQFRKGIFTITTSPRGRGWLYEFWRKGDPNFPEAEPEKYLSLRVRTLDNPHLSPSQLEMTFANYTDRQKQQELEGAFLDPEDAVFSWESIQAISDTTRPDVRELVKEVDSLELGNQKELTNTDYRRFSLMPKKNRSYILSWDIGTTATRSQGRNATVLFGIDITDRPWRIVAFRRETSASYPEIIEWIKDADNFYRDNNKNQVWTVIDSTGSGNVVKEILQDQYNLDVQGLVYSMATKPEVITAGAVCLDRRLVISPPIRAVMDEFSGYEMDDKRIVQDCVIALCQGLYHARLRAGDYARTISGETLVTRTNTMPDRPRILLPPGVQPRDRNQRVNPNSSRNKRINTER